MQENFGINSRKENNNDNNRKALEINYEVADNFLETAKWSNRLSILGISVCVIMVGIAIAAFIFAIIDKSKDTGGYAAIIIFFIAIIVGFHSIPTYFLFNASRNLKNGIMEGDPATALKGIKKIKSFFQFATVLTTILLVLNMLGRLSSLFMQN